MCRFHQQSSESPFTKGPMATLALFNGRVFVTKDKFVKNINGKTTEQALTTAEEFKSCLAKHFKLVI